jgi:dipeptidyl-peptidase-4
MHRYNLSPNSKWASHSYSSFNTPSTTEIISLPDHKTIRVNEDNKELKEKLAQLKLGNSEFFQIEIEPGVSLDGFMIKPWNFDPAKKYPVLFYIYGEPAGQTVLDRFSGSNYLWHQMLTQQGYIIMSVDNRGTPGPKGREWRKCIYGQIGILASEDQAAALRKINEWSFVDSTRIGIWGWSGGGTMSLNCIFRYPDLYQTAMAVAFVADQKLYDTIYQERYMGLPSTNPEGYKNGSPVNFAHQLKGHLLLVHGTGDDNVHYQNTELLINELIRQNKMVTVMPYPNRSHGIFEGENTTRHLYETLTRFLNTNLPAGPK